MPFCDKCNAYIGSATRQHCWPHFVWRDGYHSAGDDGARVFAPDHASAAEQWAEDDDSDSAEYYIMHGDKVTLRVRREDDVTKEMWFEVSGEAVPQYHAYEIFGRASVTAETVYLPSLKNDEGNK